MISLNRGRPIAKIEGGLGDGEIVHIISDTDNKCCEKCSQKCRKKKCCGGCNMCCNQEDEYEESYQDDGNLGKEFDVEARLSQIPNPNNREIIYISGPSGSGKSTHTAKIAQFYKKQFPKNNIYIFSRTSYKDDPAFSQIRMIQVPIDERLVETPLDITGDFSGPNGSMVIFDDCNTIQNDKVKQEVDKLMCDMMEVGRKLNIYIIITNHLVIPNERRMARTIMNEIHSLTVFPKSGSAQQISYCLKTYFGLTRKQIKQILQLPSRWVTINKSYPQYVLHEKGVYLL